MGTSPATDRLRDRHDAGAVVTVVWLLKRAAGTAPLRPALGVPEAMDREL